METLHWLAFALGAVPALYLATLPRPVPAKWWVLAIAFGVSFIADVVALSIGPGDGTQKVSQVYPLLQAGLFALVLAPSAIAAAVVAVAFAASSASLMLRLAMGWDVLLHVIAWGSVSAMAWTEVPRGRLRTTLAAGFAALAAAWYVFAVLTDPGVPHPHGLALWTSVVCVRFVVAIGFCMAAHEASRWYRAE